MSKTVDVAIGIVIREGTVLICQRRNSDSLGGYWEFPGGKIEPGESRPDCLRRELREELAIGVHPIEELQTIEFDYGDVVIRLHPFLCSHTDGEARPLAAQQMAWVTPRELGNYKFPPANDGLIAYLVERFGDAIDRENRLSKPPA